MEFFVCIGILIFIKLVEWSWAILKFCFKIVFAIISFPFTLLFGRPASYEKPSQKPKQKANYYDPIEKAIDHWDNNPEDLDMEDMFWLDELMGDD